MKRPISFTSGQLMDIMSALEALEEKLYHSGDRNLSLYYMQMVTRFQTMLEILEDLPGEKRVAELIVSSSDF